MTDGSFSLTRKLAEININDTSHPQKAKASYILIQQVGVTCHVEKRSGFFDEEKKHLFPGHIY